MTAHEQSSESAASMSETDTDRAKKRLELVAVVVLSVTTILTAWTAFQSSKWGGAMSIAFSQASAQRIEAARLDGQANRRATIQVGLWNEWVVAQGESDLELAEYMVGVFPEPLATAHADWVAAGAAEGSGVATPFAMPSYVIPESVEAAEADARADELFDLALRNNQRGDNYTLLTVLFAAVLFFAAMSGRVEQVRNQRALLSIAVLLAVVGIAILAGFPKLV